jgi:hypothetical protein
MSTRDREPDPGPLRYAPEWARMEGPEQAARRYRPRRPSAEPVPLRAAQPSSPPPTTHASPSPPPPSRPREPPWHAKKPRGAFEGDIAIQELRQRMALAPDLPPSPPLRRDRGAALGIALRLGGLVALAAIAAYAFVWFSTPHPQAADDALPVIQTLAGGDQSEPESALDESGMSPALFRPLVSPSEPGASRKSDKAHPADYPQRLPTGAWPLPDRGGDVPPSSVSPTTGAAVPSPAAGPQRPAAPGPSVPRTSAASPAPDREEVAALVARGQTYLANGDVVSARLVFRRAAEAGDAPAALALGGTFDPMVLKSLGVIGVVADAAQARNWYQKAAELGSREAPQRIDQLAQWAR